MSNSESGGCLAIFIPVGYIAAWLGSGYLAYNWIDPDSFGRVLVFLVAWGIIGYIFQLILLGIIAMVMNSLD
jgi:hypothetical protein